MGLYGVVCTNMVHGGQQPVSRLRDMRRNGWRGSRQKLFGLNTLPVLPEVAPPSVLPDVVPLLLPEPPLLLLLLPPSLPARTDTRYRRRWTPACYRPR